MTSNQSRELRFPRRLLIFSLMTCAALTTMFPGSRTGGIVACGREDSDGWVIVGSMRMRMTMNEKMYTRHCFFHHPRIQWFQRASEVRALLSQQLRRSGRSGYQTHVRKTTTCHSHYGLDEKGRFPKTVDASLLIRLRPDN